MHVLKVYNLMSLTYEYTCETSTTTKVISTFIASQNVLLPFVLFCFLF